MFYDSLNWCRQCSKCRQMSLEFSDSDTLLNYTGIVKTWSTCGQECVSVGVEGGSGCQRFDASRGNMCFSLRVRSSGGWEMLQVPALKPPVPDSLLSPQGPPTAYRLLPLDGGPILIPAGGLWLQDPIRLCSPFPG